jgi:hypothetical protein
MMRISARAERIELSVKLVYALKKSLLFVVPSVFMLLLAIMRRLNPLRLDLWKKTEPLTLFSLLCTSGVFIAYVNACWEIHEDHPRYFLVIVPFFCLFLSKLFDRPILLPWRVVIALMAAACIVVNGYQHRQYIVRNAMTDEGQAKRGAYAMAQRIIAKNQTNCLHIGNWSLIFYLRDYNYAVWKRGEFYRKYTDLPICRQ